MKSFKDYQARHFLWEVSADGRVATLRLNRPERKNPLTFDSYAELSALFRTASHEDGVKAFVVTGEGENFVQLILFARDGWLESLELVYYSERPPHNFSSPSDLRLVTRPPRAQT